MAGCCLNPVRVACSQRPPSASGDPSQQKHLMQSSVPRMPANKRRGLEKTGTTVVNIFAMHHISSSGNLNWGACSGFLRIIHINLINMRLSKMRTAFSFHAIHFKPQVLKSFFDLFLHFQLFTLSSLFGVHIELLHAVILVLPVHVAHIILYGILSRVNEKSFAGGDWNA